MSRSGYSYDIDDWDMIRWRGQVASAIRGKRGQKLLKDLRDALLAMPEKRLITHELKDSDGEVCALGALGKARGMDLDTLDPEDYDAVAAAFDIAHQLSQEIVWLNDEYGSTKKPDGTWGPETPEERYTRMLSWVESQIKTEAA